MQDWAARFYKSRTWERCRAGYAASVGGLCERCLKRGVFVPGVIVHHKTHITPDNISDPSIVLSWDNLELLCRDCHGQEHQKIQRRYRVDAFGNVESIGE